MSTQTRYRDGVAAPNLRIVRRPKNGSRKSLVAASQLLDDPAKSFKASVIRSTAGDWQELAWEMLDQVGELRYYVAWRSNSASRVRLIASELDPETGLPTGECENPRVRQIVASIAGGPLGQGQLLKRNTECLTVPGEVWIAILAGDIVGKDSWYALTRDEIKRTGETVELLLPDGSTHEVRPGSDTMFRIWNPHPRKAWEADSPVRATMDSLREIVRTTKTINNASKSRLIGNGVVFVPQEMSLPQSDGPAAVGSAEVSGTPAVQALQELLFQVAQTAIEDEDSMAALIPMFAAVPGDQVKNVSHLKFDNEVTKIAIETRNDAIARLAMGLDVSPERLLGLGKNSNHWTAWNITEEDVRLHILPAVETFCSALTEQVLTVLLARENIDPTKYVIWHDATELTVDPDKTDEATGAADRGAISLAAYRDFLGLGADSGYDLSTEEGWAEWARDRVSMKPELLKDLLPLLPELADIAEDLKPAPPPQLVPGQPQNELPPGEQPGQEGPPPEPSSAAPVRQAASLTPQNAVVELMVNRALELAGKRRRTRADYDRLRDVPMHETHRFMAPASPEDVPALIRGWDSALEADVMERLGVNTDDLRAVVRRRVLDELTRQVVDA